VRGVCTNADPLWKGPRAIFSGFYRGGTRHYRAKPGDRAAVARNGAKAQPWNKAEGWLARRRRLDHADLDRRQHQRTDHHDRREGRGHNQGGDAGGLRPLPSLRGANGSRECAPDDRLRDEAIHLS
jgi:hypothetical protein